jgi:hypothetical protein
MLPEIWIYIERMKIMQMAAIGSVNTATCTRSALVSISGTMPAHPNTSWSVTETAGYRPPLTNMMSDNSTVYFLYWLENLWFDPRMHLYLRAKVIICQISYSTRIQVGYKRSWGPARCTHSTWDNGKLRDKFDMYWGIAWSGITDTVVISIIIIISSSSSSSGGTSIISSSILTEYMVNGKGISVTGRGGP